MDEKLLRDILEPFGPSGREEAVQEVIRDFLAPYCDEIWTDALGNLYALRRGKSGKKIMLSAHMDQIGLIATDIDEHGFVYVARVGGTPTILSIAREIVFENGVHGVTYYGSKTKKVGEIGMEDLYVDIGARTREEAEAKISIGDMAIFVSNFVDLGSSYSCRTMDNRVCCAILVQAMQEMESDHDIYAVFTVQEEVGLRGAQVAGDAVMPDLCINLDTTDVGDLPECLRMNMKLGAGPAVKVCDGNLIAPGCVRTFIKKAAEENGITVQDEVLLFGGTDAGAIQLSGTGVLAGCISIPTRYIHTPVETVDKGDVDGAVRLLRACCAQRELPEMKGVRR